MAAAPVPPVPNAAPADAPLSEVARIVDTFVAPSKTFTDIRRSAAWWAPWLLVSISAMAFAYTVDVKVGFRRVVEQQIHASPKAERQMDSLSPADRETQVSARATGTKGFVYAALLTVVIFYMIMGGILFLIFKFAINAQLRFWQSIAIVAYAGLPGILKYILSIVSLAAGASPDSFDINNPVGTNLGYFLDASQVGAFMHTALSLATDVFILWTVLLCGLGYSIVGKVKLSTSMIVNFAVLAGFVLLFGGLATLGS